MSVSLLIVKFLNAVDDGMTVCGQHAGKHAMRGGDPAVGACQRPDAPDDCRPSGRPQFAEEQAGKMGFYGGDWGGGGAFGALGRGARGVDDPMPTPPRSQGRRTTPQDPDSRRSPRQPRPPAHARKHPGPCGLPYLGRETPDRRQAFTA